MRYVNGGKIILLSLDEDVNEIIFDYPISIWSVYHKNSTPRRSVYGRMRISADYNTNFMGMDAKKALKLLKPGKANPGLHFSNGPVNIKFQVGNRIMSMKQAYFDTIGIDDSKDKKFFLNHMVGRSESIIFEKRK